MNSFKGKSILVMSLVLFQLKNYKISVNQVNCLMNIKLTHNQPKASSKSKSKNHDSKSFKPSLKLSAKHSIYTRIAKTSQNAKSPSNTHNLIPQTKSPPLLKRENTEESTEPIKKNKTIKQSPELLKQNGYKESKKKNRQLQGKKFHSDDQSTNIYLYNKQSADQQQDPYKITESNKFIKQRSIKPSRDLSVSLMCNISSKESQRLKKITEIDKISEKHEASMNDLKFSIKKKLKDFKSLSKFHSEQNEYYTKKIEITSGEKKRLEKMHFIELNNIRDEIFQLRDLIQTRIQKAE